MKEKILNNISLKLLSIACAVVIWAVIVNVYDPNTSTTITSVPVQLINGSSLTDQGYAYDVVDGSKISVYISGPKSVVADIKASDIVATADLSKVSAFADYVDIDVKVERDGRAVSGVTVTPRTSALKLNIENRVSMSFDVIPEVTGTPAQGYVVTGTKVSPDAVIITGSTSNIGRILNARAYIDVSGISGKYEGSADIILYDNDGKKIDSGTVQLSRSKADFTVSVANSKTVSISAETSGKPADGYTVSGIEMSEKNVTVAGEDSILSGISSITIPSNELNVDGLTEDKSFRFWLSDYAPAGTTIVSDNMVTVNVKISGQNTRTLQIPTSQISITGEDEKLDSVIDSQSVSVVISGDKTLIDSANMSDIKLSINLSGLGEGKHKVNVSASTEVSGVTVAGGTSVDVTIGNKQEEATETESAKETSATTMQSTTANQ